VDGGVREGGSKRERFQRGKLGKTRGPDVHPARSSRENVT